MIPLDHFRFIRIWLSGLFAVMAVIALLNVLVDPIGAFSSIHLRALDLYRPKVDNRLAKAELAHQPGWDIVILGSSRVLAGFPADYPLFRSTRTVNLAMTAAVLPELAAALRTVRANNGKTPRMVIMGIDFYMFSGEANHVLDFLETRFNPDLDLFDYYAKRLIGLKTSEDSLATLKSWIRGKPSDPQDRGGFIKYPFPSDRSHREVFGYTLPFMGAGYRQMQYFPSNRIEILRQIVHECRDQGIDLRLVIMPVHALENELVFASGNGGNIENFKRRLVRFLADDGLEGKVPLLDANGYAGPPSEEIPPMDVHGLRMKYFVENSHATPAMGEAVLNRLFDVGGTNQFGVFLTTTNIEDHLQQERKDRAEYLRTHPEDGKWPQRIVESLPPLKRRAATNAPAKNP